ncbi:MAG: hypothetical protein ACQEWI_07730 [Bacillota bacterium]
MKHLEQELGERNLKLLRMQVIEGAHAGNIYRIEVLDLYITGPSMIFSRSR